MSGLIQEIWQRILLFWSSPLFYLGPVSVSIEGISKTLLWLLIIVAGCRLLKRVLSHYLLARMGIDQGNREALSTIISYLVGALSSITLLQATGFNLASLAVVAGALGVGIGFGLQNFSRDFMALLDLICLTKAAIYDVFLVKCQQIRQRSSNLGSSGFNMLDKSSHL